MINIEEVKTATRSYRTQCLIPWSTTRVNKTSCCRRHLGDLAPTVWRLKAILLLHVAVSLGCFVSCSLRQTTLLKAIPTTHIYEPIKHNAAVTCSSRYRIWSTQNLSMLRFPTNNGGRLVKKIYIIRGPNAASYCWTQGAAGQKWAKLYQLQSNEAKLSGHRVQ